MSRGERKGMQDLLNEGYFPFSETKTFQEAYSEVATFEVEVEQKGKGCYGGTAVYKTGGQAPGEFIGCSNSMCTRGGFPIGQVIRTMTGQRSAEHSQQFMHCKGFEGSPQGRRKYGSCNNYVNIRVRLTFKPPA
jgi:hypothetical protein